MKSIKTPSVPCGNHSKDKKPSLVSPMFDAVVREGDTIRFDQTGEEIRIAKIESGKITFAKHP